MIFDHENEKSEKEDFFDGPDLPEPVKEPKKPAYKPDDPAYWEEEESQWEHLKPEGSKKKWLWISLAVIVIALSIACWLRFFSPYIEEATQYGYVEHLEKRGIVFKTYEGVLLPYKELTDTTRIYSRDFIFTAENVDVAKQLRAAQKEGRPVEVTYKVFHATLPWRGAAKTVVTAVDSVDVNKILPPEFASKNE